MIASAPTSSRTETRADPDAPGRIDGLRVTYSVTAATATRETTSAQASTNPMSRAPSSQRPSRPGSPRSRSGIQMRPPITTAQATGIETAGLLDSHRRREPAAPAAPPPAAEHEQRRATRSGQQQPGRGVDVDSGEPHGPCSYILFRSMTTRPGKTLETFPNPKPERDYVIRFECPEFTCLCPKTGPAGLRHHPRRVRPRRALRRAQVLEALPLVVPRRGRVPRGGDQPDPRRPGGGHRARGARASRACSTCAAGSRRRSSPSTRSK